MDNEKISVDDVWLVLAEHPRYHKWGKVVRLTHKEPALDRGEKAIKVTIKLPTYFFKDPQYQLTLEVPDTKGASKDQIIGMIEGSLSTLNIVAYIDTEDF
jgi:hypothetical protein